MRYKIFLSHSIQDWEEIVKILEKVLKKYGFDVYIAQRDKQYGRELSQKIKRNIEDADVVIVIWTKNSEYSAWVNQEVGYAIKCNKLVIPLIEEGVSLTGFLKGMEYLSFDRYDKDSIENAAKEIADYLSNIEDKELRQLVTTVVVIIIFLVVIYLLLEALKKNE